MVRLADPGTAADQLTILAARGHRQELNATAAAVSAAVLTAWDDTDMDHVERSWLRQVARKVKALLTAGQLAAARRAVRYTQRQVQLRPDPPLPTAVVVPERLAGVTSDGRPLERLLVEPARTVRRLRREGRTLTEAELAGRVQLDMIVRTQIADASRVASGVEVTATPRMGYIRIASPTACSRCILLAGQWYPYSTGFLRHPRCQCSMTPCARDDAPGLTDSPMELFEGMSEEQQNRTFGRAGAQAIRDGADIYRIVNARQGLYTAQLGGRRVLATRAGSRVVRRRLRIMPETIYQVATDREDALRLLRANGFIR